MLDLSIMNDGFLNTCNQTTMLHEELVLSTCYGFFPIGAFLFNVANKACVAYALCHPCICGTTLYMIFSVTNSNGLAQY